MNQEILYDILRKLAPSGADGFEGLIAKLLGNLIGRKFFLSKSGFQGGRDMSTGGFGANNIAVECKRFQSNTELNDREILGELTQAYQNFPGLDLWMLVASRKVPDQLHAALSSDASDKGVEVFIIETDDSKLSQLTLLCASAPDLLVQHIKSNLSSEDHELLEKILKVIRNKEYFNSRLEKLRDDLSPATIGFDNWRVNQHQWFLERLSREESARSAFGQLLNIADSGVKLIDRRQASEQLRTYP